MSLHKLVFVLSLAFLAVASVAAPTFAHTVTMNFHFVLEDGDDVVHTNETDYTTPQRHVFRSLDKKYVSAERNSTIAALAFAGQTFLGLSFDTVSLPFKFSIEQDEQDARFLLALTQGTWRDIDVAASQSKIPPRTFSPLDLPQSFSNTLSLQFYLANIVLDGKLSSGRILIKNVGRQRLPLVNITQIG